jgi:hypothetical protein
MIQMFYKSPIGYIRVTKLIPLLTPFIYILKMNNFCP